MRTSYGLISMIHLSVVKAQSAQKAEANNQNSVTENTVSGKTKEVKEDKAFTLYPNPSEGKFRIDIGDRPLTIEQTMVEVFTEEGKMVYSANYDQHEIDVSKFSKGTYLIKVGDGDRKYINKVIFQ